MIGGLRTPEREIEGVEQPAVRKAYLCGRLVSSKMIGLGRLQASAAPCQPAFLGIAQAVRNWGKYSATS
jgi:hypothetical protein